MAGSENDNEGGWKQFRPSKTMWFWSSVVVVFATIFMGFGWGGWITGGKARHMADEAADKARAQLVADVCVERYVNSGGFAGRLAKLKEGNAWDRQEMIEKGDWLELPGIENPSDNAADLCVNELVSMEMPGQSETTASESEKNG